MYERARHCLAFLFWADLYFPDEKCLTEFAVRRGALWGIDSVHVLLRPAAAFPLILLSCSRYAGGSPRR
jgi:hypothetical protein